MANFDWNDADSADLIQKVFTGDINIANLPIELYEKTANYLTQGVYDVYGIGYDQSIMAPEFETIRHLKANIHVFSAAKTFQSILDIQSQLFDDDGNIRSFRDFEQRASKIESLYNKAWLRAEYRTTINQARSAKNWDRYSSQKNTFPYLRYETKDDSKVRPEHASMDGITLPVDHPFWNQYFPPNGWNCRCTITQIRKATSTKLDQIGTTDDGTPEFKGVTLPDQLFRLNSGKHQVIFVDDKQKGLSHPYFKVDTRYKAYQDRNFDMPIPNDVKDLVKTSQKIETKVETIVPDFVPAKNLVDAEKYARDVLGVKEFNFKGWKMDLVNELNDTLRKTKAVLSELEVNAWGSQQQFMADAKLKIITEYKKTRIYKDALKDYGEKYADKVADDASKRLMKLGQFKSGGIAYSTKKTRIGIGFDAESGQYIYLDTSSYSGVHFNDKYKSKNFAEFIGEQMDRKWFTKAKPNLSYVVNHELGHEIDKLLDFKKNPDFMAIYKREHANGKNILIDRLSEYGATAGKIPAHKPDEMIAEAWAEFTGSNSPRELSNEIGNLILNTYYDKFATKINMDRKMWIDNAIKTFRK